MSVIDEALRKLEDERSQRVRQDSGGEYMAAPRLAAPSSSYISRLLWMILGGGVVAVVVWMWVENGNQRPAPVAPVVAVSPVAALIRKTLMLWRLHCVKLKKKSGWHDNILKS